MMKIHPRLISQTLTGLVGAVIALVVVAYIGLVPLAAQTSSTSTTCEDAACTCQGNMYKLGLALLQYYQDYDEKFPVGQQGPPSAGVGWFGAVSNYDRGRAYYKCPSDPTTATKPQYALSYGFNANLSSLSQAALTEADLTVLSFEVSGTPIYTLQYDEGASQGAEVFSAAGDGTDGHLLAGKDASLAPGVDYATGNLGKRPSMNSGSQFSSRIGRHYRGANYVLDDGHVKFFHPADVSGGTPATNSGDAQTGTTTGKAAGTMNNAYQATFSPI